MNGISSTACPVVPREASDRVLLAHGEGGRLMRQLIGKHLLPALANPILSQLGDAAVLPTCNGRLALTTDSYVVSPLFFPGGDIGRLAVFGTVNDLAASGARPLWLSLAMILEEGFSLETLDRILNSIAAAARTADVTVVAGDTKVVPRGAADGIFLTTTGVGQIVEPAPVGLTSLQAGDRILVSGPIGRHGIAVLAARENLGFDPPPESDCAPLTALVVSLRDRCVPVRALRDATRGGLAAVFHEWAAVSRLSFVIDEHELPVTPDVRGACELLGLDPLHVACEGVMALAVPAEAEHDALAALRSLPLGSAAACVGRAAPRTIVPVVVRRGFGREIPLDEPLGAPLPRIC